MHLFASPLRPEQQQTAGSLRAAQYTRKRAAADADMDTDSDNDDDADADADDGGEALGSLGLGLGAHRGAQSDGHGGRGAPGDGFQMPASPFPHAPPRQPRPRLTPTAVQQQLAGLAPALYPAAPARSAHDGPALRTTHLNVLATVMHRCLLEGDDRRAARAWALIIRTQAHAISFDPRYNRLWGLGAELLLRRSSGIHGALEDSLDEHACSDEAFQLAKEYYERMILQYPIRKHQPRAVDATSFYPPLFSVWIMQVLERSRRARQQYKRTLRRPSDADPSVDADTTMTPEEQSSLERDILNEELISAREICQRIDELVESPPYDKDAQLLGLRGHVGLWISDLVVGKSPGQVQDSDSDHEWEGDELGDDAEPAAEPAPEMIRRCDQSLEEIEEAQGFFNRAAKCSNESLYETMSSIKRRVHEIEKQRNRLNNQTILTMSEI